MKEIVWVSSGITEIAIHRWHTTQAAYITNMAPSGQCNSLQSGHNEFSSVSNHRCSACLLIRLFRCRSKKTSAFRVIGLCEGNSLLTGEFPAKRASNADNVSILWCHHIYLRSEPILPNSYIYIASFIGVPFWYNWQFHMWIKPSDQTKRSSRWPSFNTFWYTGRACIPRLQQWWFLYLGWWFLYLASSYRNIYRVTGQLWGDPTGHEWTAPLIFFAKHNIWVRVSFQ